MSRVLKSALIVLTAALLTACGLTTPEPGGMVTATTVPSLTQLRSSPTASHTVTITPGLAPSSPTPTLTEIVPPSASPSTPALPKSSAPEGLRMVYVVEGDLYLQDGNNPPLQLTNSGEDSHPIFSDDGEKIAYFHGAVPYDLYVINADGSDERALVTNEMLMALGHGYDELFEVYIGDLRNGSTRVYSTETTTRIGDRTASMLF